MASNLTVIGNKEILLVAETIAHEKGINLQQVVQAMEEGIALATKRKYGTNLNIECAINEKTGRIQLSNKIEVIKNSEEPSDRSQISLAQAKKKNSKIKIGDFITEELPPIDLNRVVAHIAKNEIVKRIKIAEKEKEYEKFENRVGEIIYASVKKVGLKNIVMEIEGFEAVIHQKNLIPRENFRVGDRVRVYIEDVRKEEFGAQIFLSRTHSEFLIKLFSQEVPELYEGNIEVKAVARDPGSRSKIAVHSDREDVDTIGSLVGVRGSRVQAVSSELKGEKIDIIKWSANLAELVIAALSPAEINKVIIDEENKIIEVVVSENNLSLAIGRSGQNVRLASKLVEHKIDIITQEEESARRTAEFNQSSKVFAEILDVEEMIANLLAAEGFSSIEEIVNASEKEIEEIEGFDIEIAKEIKNRASEYVKNKEQSEL